MRRGFLNKPGAFANSTKSDAENLSSSLSKLTVTENIPKSNPDIPTPTTAASPSPKKTTDVDSKPRSLGWPIVIPKIAAMPENGHAYADVYRKAGHPKAFVQGCCDEDSSGIRRAFCAWLSLDDLSNVDLRNMWSTPTSVPYHIIPVKGSGLGLVADRMIAVGETIRIERPVLLTPHWFPYDDMVLHQMHQTMLEALEPNTVTAIKSLYNCKPVTKDPWSEMEGIIDTNALHCPFPQSQYLPHYQGVFLDISRCNHSCAPNATWEWDHLSLLMELRAIRPINAGDEISVSYVAQWKARSKRQDELKATYNFTCCCPACEPPSPKKSRTTKSKSTKLMSEKRAVIAASDGRRMLISSSMAISDGLWEQWAAPTSSLPSTKIVEFHEGVLLLRAEEGYRKGSEINIAYLAHAYAALGDREGFTHWSTKLMEWRPWGPGPTGLARRATWERWVEDPTLSPAWGLRGTGNSQIFLSRRQVPAF